MLKRLDRGAGVLLPISSLPSPYGIGTMGREAYKFTDELVKAVQKAGTSGRTDRLWG